MSTKQRGTATAPPRPPATPPNKRQSAPAPKRSRRDTVHMVTGRLLLLMFAVTVSLIAGCVGGLALSLSKLPDVGSLQKYVPPETTKIFDAHGKLIANVHGEENRVVIPLHDIPKSVQHAVIAMEDTDFYYHYGVNPKGITRAVLVNVAEGASVEGASTLTQQLAKNLFLEPAKSLPRKISEAWLAIQIEHHYSKAQILEMYLNQVYWGHNAYGIEAASLNYFGKSTRKLTLAESAMLAGILRGPEAYSPYRNPTGAKHLQKLVLERMVVAGFIQPKQAREAEKQVLHYPGSSSYAYKVPYFTAHLIADLIKRYGENMVLKGGLRVQSTLDLDLQEKAETMLREAVARNIVYNIHQGALVAVDPRTGFVRALVGGTDFKKYKFNRAVQALRPPGSTFKPFVYLTALSAGFSPGSVIVDEPISLPSGPGVYYSPSNYDHSFRGALTMRQALEKSVNIVAVKLGYNVGVKRVIRTAHELGLTSKLGENLSLPLGTSEVTPFEMADAYATIANDGMRNPATMVIKIQDRNGRIIEDNRPKPKRVYDAEPIRLLVNMMQGVINHGTGTAAQIDRPAAGKTGTTSDARDVWFAGFTPDMACVVWMGNDNNSRLAYSSTGGTVVAPLWAQFMRYALRNTKPHAFKEPGNVTTATINRHTGQLTNPLDREGVTETFQRGHEPKSFEPVEVAPRRREPKPTAEEPIAPIEVPQERPVAPIQMRPVPVARPKPAAKRTAPPMELIVTPQQTDETLLEAAPELPPENR
ncbi:MAG: penicillin-binding protein [Cyanobacteria bacterium RYN_339]|nr:penicillin-binding protein [Cyanobacteria bacterium RYN_339]